MYFIAFHKVKAEHSGGASRAEGRILISFTVFGTKANRAIYTRTNKTRTGHLYEQVLSKTKTVRINGSRLISVLDSFSCE